MDSVTDDKVRRLSLNDLGIPNAKEAEEPTPESLPLLPETDEVLRKVRAALDMKFAGVILAGPPGTGKSWYARRIAATIAGDAAAVRTVQFHPSYQYEDFMEGYAPTASGSFQIERKVFSLLCNEALERPLTTHVLVIDELSRSDVARVFGEALTYLEVDKRDIPFRLASGREIAIPKNLVILATMNSWDKGVDELDVALERRFAQIDLLPDGDTLRTLLLDKGADSLFVGRVVTFFTTIQGLDDDTVHLGHAYFLGCTDPNESRNVWEFRLRPFFERACRLDRVMFDNIKRQWRKVVPEDEDSIVDDGTDSAAPRLDDEDA